MICWETVAALNNKLIETDEGLVLVMVRREGVTLVPCERLDGGRVIFDLSQMVHHEYDDRPELAVSTGALLYSKLYYVADPADYSRRYVAQYLKPSA